MNMLFLRGGYKLNVEGQSFTVGGGLAATISGIALGFDYGYAAYANLGGVHRISMNVKL
jgi:hypothetical protein